MNNREFILEKINTQKYDTEKRYEKRKTLFRAFKKIYIGCTNVSAVFN